MRFHWRRLKPGEIDHELIWGSIGVCVLVGIPVWTLLFGSPPLRCHFHALTGFPCLTCGSTRALLALSHFHAFDAWRLNPLCALLWMAWALYVPYGLVTSLGRLPRLRVILSARDWFVARFAVPALAIANWAWLIWDKR